ncbi:MAG: TIR domain-containing protein, partial [Erythrobacter sp.]|nr:TIR domain-containing protein [Erythrobacter sp.]
MADLFLSYARDDQSTVDMLAAALEARGYSVWWDRHMESGAQFSKEIEQQIERAKATLVCWSRESAESRWVRDEANYAAERDKLLAVTLDGTLPPMGFGQFHALSLEDWKGDAQALTPLINAVAHKLGDEADDRAPALPVPEPKLKASWLVVAIAAFLAAVGALVIPTLIADDYTAEEAMQASIAVLPFEALSEDESDEYFGRGIAEELLNSLSKFPDLKVAGRASAFSFEDSDALNNEIGEQLGVEHILQGTVRRAGDRVRITASLTSAGDGTQLWSETYERELTDIFAIQDDIVEELARVLQFRLGVGAGAGRAEGRGVDPRAYEAYLRGLDFWHRREDPQNRFEAIASFKETTELDPKFADGWSALGMGVAWSSSYVKEAFGFDAVEVTENALRRARALDPGNARANAVLAAWEKDVDAALVAFDAAYDRAPNDSLVNYAGGMMYEYRGDFDAAVRHFDRALLLDPLNLTVQRVRALALGAVGRYGEVEDDIRGLATCGELCDYGHVIMAANGLVASLHAGEPAKISRWLELLGHNHARAPSQTEYDRLWLSWLEGRAREVVDGTPFTAAPFTDAQNFSLGVGMATPASLLAQGGQVENALDLLEVGYRKRELFGANDFWPLLDGRYEFPDAMRRHP